LFIILKKIGLVIMKRLNIDLGERSYDILIGRDILSKVGEFISNQLEVSRSIIITHPSVRKLFGEKVESGLTLAGYSPSFIEIPEGETSKSLQQVELVYDRLLEMKCDRKSLLIALGGGVVGDLTGFIAATYQRGIPFIQVPTTLLSQVDSSVGGKTAVNHPRGKNMIGAFYQPKLVLIDLDTLITLPRKELRAGLAEVIKYGIIADATLFDFLEKNTEKILSLNSDCLEYIIETSCTIKAQVVEKDERESRHRMILNFGHTFSHAIETLTNYTEYLHGEALSIGMIQAARLSVETELCHKDVPLRIINLLKKFRLPIQTPDLKSEDIVESMHNDKKNSHNKLRFILAKAIGLVEIVDDVPETTIKAVLNKNK
jgi:3-dehydroquinate synthase